ncbi:MAG: cellulase family glycosylhydrolase [Xanthobacteraceae bacterium]|nr:cellulase family glycosylhydrolase [Xanthobacteraceae bacterium]MCW5674566.1 cellulase family glycosylhydrolase [Xanthobacteraceae bacterium]
MPVRISNKCRTAAARFLLALSLACGAIFGSGYSQATAFEIGRAINIAQWFTWPRYEAAPATGILWPPYKNVPRPPDEAELAALKRSGFDTVRLPVDPAPFIVFEGERREEVYRILFSALAKIRGAGLNVIVDLHPNSRHPVWGQHAVAAGIVSPAFSAYLGVVEEMARRLDAHAKHAALELINEPRVKCAGAEQLRWQAMAKRLVGSARAGSKRLTLVLTGACVSSLEGLLALDPQAIGDPNLIYTFHFYDPFSFTHQGASFIPWPDKYLDEVPWPASKRPIEQSLALIEKRVAAAPKLDDTARQRAADGARANLQKYYRSNAGAALISERFAKVAEWAKVHDIPAKRIFVGEFGVIRKAAGSAGALCEDRMQWLHDIRATAEQFGFNWAYFNYDGAFAIVKTDTDRRLDPDVLASLGLLNKTVCQDGE